MSTQYRNKDKEIRQKVDLFLEDKLSESETDLLWEILLKDDSAYQYMITSSSLRKMAADNEFSMSADTFAGNINIDADSLPESWGEFVGKPVTKLDPDTSQKSDPEFTNTFGWPIWKKMVAIMLMGLFLILAYWGIQNRDFVTDPAERVAAVEYIPFEIFRSADDTESGPISDVKQEIIRLSTNGNHDDAVSALYNFYPGLENIISAGTEANFETETEIDIDIDIILFSAIVHYNAGNFEESASLFRKVIATNAGQNLEDKALWYGANAELMIGNTENASEYLKILSKSDGAFKRPAQSLLDKL
ncbi:MAG: hypothetical protein LAT67_01070 [Balneolales bacterium]|nr:hypothetical protein [Balneolales bacterium]